MKQLLSSILFLLLMNSGFAQNLNFPDSNAVWSVYNKKYFVDGDSTLNSIGYKKYFVTNDIVVSTGDFFCLLREDTISKRIFAIPAGSAEERIIYDFSLEEGDTISVYPLSFPDAPGPITVEVDAIDSILLGSDYHKRLKISGVNQNTGYDEYWIEGIGSTMGVFNSGITGIVIFDIYYPALLCFEKDGVLLYDNPNFADCYQDQTIGVEDMKLELSVVLFPNPSAGLFFIKSESEILSYKIESLLGKTIIEGTNESQTVNFNLSNYSDGLYFITITTGAGVVTRTVLKNGL